MAVVSAFLKARGLHHSAGSWQAMREGRLLPALEQEKISNEDLEALVQESEEYGHQHVFLYTCSKAAASRMIDRVNVERELTKRKQSHLLNASRLVEQPSGVELVDVRWDTARKDYQLTLKEVELRTYDKLIGTRQEGDEFLKVYKRETQRAVNLARLHIDGSLELRLTSHRNSSKYENDIYKFFVRMEGLLTMTEFRELSLTPAKDYIWSHRRELAGSLRYADSTVRDAAGNLLQAAAGGKGMDLNEDEAVAGSLDRLRDEDEDSYCDTTNIYFKAGDEVSAETHVILSGEVNEFALPANCTKADYEHVLAELKRFNS
ncbi:hypothetical protein [Achromobacter insuavis]|uniref:hypothetical protein n=1 Tax=Achromobacter insuavis TaxID=1287735 RepID=UPI001F13A899|nr:hypothetical protein [Achromobacter insuavis]